MARNGTGVYSNPNPNFDAGKTISSNEVDANNSDIATALTESIARDGQTTITANLPMTTHRHTGVGNALARTDYAAAGQIADGALTWGGTAAGTADALTISLSPAITNYATNMRIGFKASINANTGAATIAVNGLLSKALEINNAALAAGDIVANKYYELLYDGTAFQLTRLSGVQGGDVVGPALSTNNSLARFDGTTGALLKDGAVIGTDVLAPTGDGSGLTGIATGATVAEKANISLNSFRIAVNGGLSVQNMIDGVVDEFTDETGVDTVTSTNETYDATGDYYHNNNPVLPRLTGATPTSPVFPVDVGVIANINDDSLATEAAIGTSLGIGDLTAASVANRIIAQLDYGTAQTITKFEVKQIRTSGVSTVDAGAQFYYSSDAITWTAYSTTFTIPVSGSPADFVKDAADVTARYVAVVAGQTLFSSAGVYLKAFNGYQPGLAPNMTLQSNTHTALVQPSSVFAVLWHEPVDTVTLNADLTVEVSRDGGTTWTAATLALSANLVGNEQILTGTADVSAQPAGMSIKWRIKALNNKEQRLHGVSEQWS